MVLSPNERNMVGRMSYPMRCFAEVLNELGIRDIPLQVRPFNDDNHSMSRLDIFLITADWECQFNNVV